MALGDQENRNFLFGLENGTIVRPLRIGEFEKVLRRLYRLAGIARVRFLRRRALVDILTNPGLAERICDYIRSSGTALEYLNFSSAVMAHPEQVYPDGSSSQIRKG